jgi:hypothetical protein
LKSNSGGIRHDYKDDFVIRPKRRRWALFVLGFSLPLAATALLLLGTPRQPVPARPVQAVVEPSPSSAPPSVSLAALDVPASAEVEIAPAVVPAEPLGTTLDLLVKRGDTLEVLFRRNG